MRPLFTFLLVNLALAGTTSPVGRVGRVVDLREAVPAAARAQLPLEPTEHRKRMPVGKDQTGEVEIVWTTAEVDGANYVLDVSLEVVKEGPDIEVMDPVVIPPLYRTEGLSSVGVVVGWRKDSACRGEMASVTSEVDGKGQWKEI
jgi:hypothetical protein